MPRFNTIILPGAANPARGLQPYLPVAPQEEEGVAALAPVAHARFTALRLPATPALRLGRRTNATFAAGIAVLGGGTVMALIPVLRQQLAEDDTVSTLEAALEFTASASLTLAGLRLLTIASDMALASHSQQPEVLDSVTEPSSPASPAAHRQTFVIEPGDGTGRRAVAGDMSAMHDIENPPAQADQPRARADSSEQ